MKELIEKRNAFLDELDGILAKAKVETRAFSDEEVTKVSELKDEIRKIDESIKIEEEVRNLSKIEVKVPEVRTAAEIRAEVEAVEVRQFVSILKGETRDLTATANGVVIPKTISKQIIDKVVNLCPILDKATIYSVSGDLIIPSYDFTSHVPAGYFTEMATITGQNTVFGSVTLGNNIIVSLALISKSLLNRADVDVVPFVVNEIAKALAFFIEKELVAGVGGAGKLKGLAQVAAGQTQTGVTTLVITPQELINLQLKVPQAFQGNASWIMNPATFGYLAGLTAGAGNNTLLLGNTLSEGSGYSLLGKPVFLSDNVPVNAVDALCVFYGDYSGLAVKLTSNVAVQTLVERFADTYSIGVLGSLEIDSALVEPQKVAALKGK